MVSRSPLFKGSAHTIHRNANILSWGFHHLGLCRYRSPCPCPSPYRWSEAYVLRSFRRCSGCFHELRHLCCGFPSLQSHVFESHAPLLLPELQWVLLPDFFEIWEAAVVWVRSRLLSPTEFGRGCSFRGDLKDRWKQDGSEKVACGGDPAFCMYMFAASART